MDMGYTLYGGCHSLDGGIYGCAIARLSDMASTGTIIDIRVGSNNYMVLCTQLDIPLPSASPAGVMEELSSIED